MTTRWLALSALIVTVGCVRADGGAQHDSSESAAQDAAVDGSSSEPESPGTLDDGCPRNSGFPGDDRCLAAPDPDDGFQLHYGPSDYADRDEVESFVLEPGEELTDCFLIKTPNDRDVYVSGYQIHMRDGSHHLLANVRAEPQPDGFAPCEPGDGTPGLLAGSQAAIVDRRERDAPEDQGISVLLPARSQVVINFHVVNTSDEPLLREAWFNYFYIDEADVTAIRGNVFLAGGYGYFIEPGESLTSSYSCSPQRPVRVLALTAHMHAHATRMSAWKVSAGTRSLVYETFDWNEPTVVQYDSAHDGTLILEPGDSLEWECDVTNTSEQTLTFRNEVYTGEMCVMTGAAVPVDDPMAPYDFECNRN